MKTHSTLRTLLSSTRWLAAAASVVALSAPVAMASAEPSATFSRTTIVPMDRYHRETRIVRERSVGKEHVLFSADAQPIDSAARLIFEIRSESDDRAVVRWRCTAVNDVSECFDKPVKVRYLPEDARVVLSVRLAPEPAFERYAQQ